jgi:L-amino acid N-acyltransferase YncA
MDGYSAATERKKVKFYKIMVGKYLGKWSLGKPRRRRNFNIKVENSISNGKGQKITKTKTMGPQIFQKPMTHLKILGTRRLK